MGDIVEIGDFSLARKHRGGYAPTGECRHNHLTLDDNGDVVRCSDCNAQVSAYWALAMIADEFSRQMGRLQAGKRDLAEAVAREVHLIAAKEVEKAWRSRTMVPSCPHCHRGIFPQDGFGKSLISREIENRRRQVAMKAESNIAKP